MILRLAGRTCRGPIVDLRGADVDPVALAAAIRGEPSPYVAAAPPAGPVHERAGYVRPGMGLRTKTALAAAARSRGLTAPQGEALARVRGELAALDPDEPPTPARQPPDDGEIERLRERVATLRGRVQALAECGRDPAEERQALRTAARRLSELETRRAASAETRERARGQRDRRERRLQLEDRAANLERAARRHLRERVEADYAAAVAALDGPSDPDEADPVTAALAVLRVAAVRAPVVLAVDRFPDPATAIRWLGAPVVRI